MMHRAYWHEGSMYYKGQVVIQAKEGSRIRLINRINTLDLSMPTFLIQN